MQTVRAMDGDSMIKLDLPDEQSEVMPGVNWGRFDEIGTPAFWAAIAWVSPDALHGFVRSTETLAEEIGFCLLGGYGVTAELATAAFECLQDNGVFNAGDYHTAEQIEHILRQPLEVRGRRVHYRFPRQRAQRIAHAMLELAERPLPEDDHIEFRRRLMDIPGIGPKTASWITRNWLDSDKVAILDIHVIRACLAMGIFNDPVKLPKAYDYLEQTFIEFSHRLGVRTAVLDAVIWTEMRNLPLAYARPH